LKKPGFRVVKNSQKKRVSRSGKPGLETLLSTAGNVVLEKTCKVFGGPD